MQTAVLVLIGCLGLRAVVVLVAGDALDDAGEDPPLYV
jgi:hypothetical protein